ncbi:MAG: tol-pal system protein YbgF [Acidobacteriota bacterium]
MAGLAAAGLVLLIGGDAAARTTSRQKKAAAHRKELAYARQKADADRMADRLISEEKARRKRLAQQKADSPAPPLPVKNEKAADADLDRVFTGEPEPRTAVARDYPAAIVTRPAEKAGAPAAPAAPAAEPPEPGSGGLDLFHAGYSAYSQGDFERAAASFSRFLTLFPRAGLADSAQYWLGECSLARGDYEAALEAYRLVIETYPEGDKVPEAWLKSSDALLGLGRVSDARRALERVVSDYPESWAAGRARERLKALAGKGGTAPPDSSS